MTTERDAMLDDPTLDFLAAIELWKARCFAAEKEIAILRAAAQAPGVRAEDYARAIYDASRDRAGLHPISNERWGEFYDSGLQEALALRAQAEACAALSDTSELGK